ncbi:MAG: DUF6502 family protein [Gammaproteobacteria bacterium]|nr:DUF6502 family protein [Gammaproteobacteria bacterium]
MEANLRQAVRRACQRLMRPIVAMLLRSGITWKEFADLSRTVFVRVATEGYGRKGRPTNVSRVAILTGLSRREVTRQRKLLDADDQMSSDSQISVAARVLSGWYQDPDFLGGDGNPVDLRRTGPHPSFESLLKRYSGDIPPVALSKELLGVGAIREQSDGTLSAQSRYYMPLQLDSNAVLRAGSVWHDLGETINHNLTRGKSEPGRFEGRATNSRLSRKAVAALQQMVEEKAQALLEESDQWLSDHESEGENEGVRAGIGIYLIDDSRSE